MHKGAAGSDSHSPERPAEPPEAAGANDTRASGAANAPASHGEGRAPRGGSEMTARAYLAGHGAPGVLIQVQEDPGTVTCHLQIGSGTGWAPYTQRGHSGHGSLGHRLEHFRGGLSAPCSLTAQTPADPSRDSGPEIPPPPAFFRHLPQWLCGQQLQVFSAA